MLKNDEYGEYMEIKLNGVNDANKVVKISPEDYNLVSKYEWCLDKQNYVVSKKIRLHLLITGIKGNNKRLVYHYNNDKLDNRRNNFEILKNIDNDKDYVEIRLKNSNDVAYVSKEDYDIVKNYIWHKADNGSAETNEHRMHRLIMGMEKSKKKIYHRDNNKLNNMRNNLILFKTKFILTDDYVKIILSNEIDIAYASLEDYDKISQYEWHKTTDGKYVEGSVKGKTITMHRFIMNPDNDKVIDHYNGNGFDNRRSNLTICTRAENARNLTISKKKNTKYRGVYYNKLSIKKYSVNFEYKSKCICIGSFDNELDAADAFDMYIVHNNINFIKLNFPEKKNEYLKRELTSFKKKLTSQYYNVYLLKDGKTFISTIKQNKKVLILCKSNNEIECAETYDKYIVENNIPNKKLNFPMKYPNYNKYSLIKTKCEEIDENTVKLLINNNNNNDINIIIDKNEYDKVKYYSWCLFNKYIKARFENNKKSLHRFIMNVTDPTIYVDHINGNTFDNTKVNLRLSNPKKNSQNRRKRENSTSIYYNVHFYKRTNEWVTRIGHKYIAQYNNEEYAARRRDIYIIDNMPESHYKMNFEWTDEDIKKWKNILNIETK
jgi:hypothetical protein